MEGVVDHHVAPDELSWCWRSVPSEFSEDRLKRDLGVFFEKQFHFSSLVPPKLKRLLHVPGIVSRLEHFTSWLHEQELDLMDENQVLEKFAIFLGRVTTFRALSLTEEEYNGIRAAGVIFSKGRLRETDEKLESRVDKEGLFRICFYRLYISLMKWADPSVSLHDDPETALIIASGYVAENKKVYLFEVHVPKIWTVGWKLADIQREPGERWFSHRECWFDSTLERTERYTMFGVPLSSTLKSVRIFDTSQQVEDFVQPFVAKQNELKAKS